MGGMPNLGYEGRRSGGADERRTSGGAEVQAFIGISARLPSHPPGYRYLPAISARWAGIFKAMRSRGADKVLDAQRRHRVYRRHSRRYEVSRRFLHTFILLF